MDWKNNCVIQLFSHFTETHNLFQWNLEGEQLQEVLWKVKHIGEMEEP